MLRSMLKVWGLLIFAVGLCFTTTAQKTVSYNVTNFQISKKSVATPKLMKPDYAVTLYNLEQPLPGGNSVKSHLLDQKIKSRKQFPVKSAPLKKAGKKAESLYQGREFGLFREISNGNLIPIYGGRPNDNTVAVSNDGIVLTSINSTIYGFDIDNDEYALTSQFIQLSMMADGLSSGHYFDPKLMYDEVADRFILVFLKNATPEDNELIICFSTTNDPDDPWNVYHLPGNPFNNDRWTDFPAIAITSDDLFFTGNLIVPDEPWQTGFDGSIIWQINKESGYNGEAALTTKLFNDIKYDNTFIRNLHTVQGADGVADEMYLLSNRNFDISNDSIFVLKVLGSSLDTLTDLEIDVYSSDLAYGVPPNGRQLDTDTLDPTSGLQTNDGRVLGAIKMNDQIQFVSNTVNPETGLSGIYHGIITSLDGDRSISGRIIGDSIKDFGYPNIAWAGNEACDIETIIGFNYTSMTDFPGVGYVYYDNEGDYSDFTITKEGEGYVDRLSGSYERWGDYFGLQRRYDEPGTVFSFGFYGTANNYNTGWCTELISPDTSKLELTAAYDLQPSLCEQIITVSVTGGEEPYGYTWKDSPNNLTSTSDALCEGDSATVIVTDARGCELEKTFSTQVLEAETDVALYPNPVDDRVVIQFELEEDALIEAEIFDINGQLVVGLVSRDMASGLNELTFSTLPLSIGEYVLVLYQNHKKLITKKFIKK